MNRRAFLSAGAGSAFSLFFADRLARLAQAGELPRATAATPPLAKALIVLYMNGGPSHLDTFDPKKNARVMGPGKAIPTALKGVEISEHLPRLASLADRLAIVRGMTSKEGNHERARYLLHTGYAPNPTVEHPALGAWAAKKLGAPENGLPPYVSIGGPGGSGGILGAAEGPLVVARGGELPTNVAMHPTIDAGRFERRRALLSEMEHEFAATTGDPKIQDREAIAARAVGLMRTPDLAAFTHEGESAEVRASFGDTDFGRGCLTALRLVAKGARVVEVTLDGWDTHKDNFGRTKKLMGTLDPAMSALVLELERRGLFQSTLVACLGDFGRTPRINQDEGRDHFPNAWSLVLAGGGLARGVIVGETDDTGSKVVKDTVTVPDLMATLAVRLGLDPKETLFAPNGRPIAVTEGGAPVTRLLGA